MASLDNLFFADSFAELSATNVQNNATLLAALWGSAEPEIDVRHGALDALVVRPAATLLEVAKQAFVKARDNSNLSLLLSESTERSRELLDAFAQNYHVTRKPGSAAAGIIRLIFSKAGYCTIGLTSRFQANGVLFACSEVQQARPADTQLANGSHVFRDLGDGSGYVFFDVAVTAQTVGSAGNLVRGTELSMVEPLPGFIRAVALETFTGGDDEEADNALVQRMVLGVSAKVLSSRVNMRAALLEQFPDIRDSFVIGAGDPEMTRDKHSVFPGSTGGYADWYVGTTLQLNTIDYVTDQVTQMFADPNTGEGGFVIYLDNSQIPCLYSVLSVQDDETLEFCTIERQLRAASEGRDSNAPMIYTDEESVFSVYHRTAVQIRAPKPPKRVRITAAYSPLITEIQNWALSSGQAPLGLDILVKAAIPTVIKFSAVLNTPAGAVIDTTLLRGLVAGYINHLPFNGLLAVSGLLALLHNNLPAGSFVAIPALFGQTTAPDGETYFSQTSDRLVVDFPPYVSNRTTLFYCDLADISFEHRFI
jgi:hypothetical protein